MSLRDVAVFALADRPRFASDREWAEKVVDALLELVQSVGSLEPCQKCGKRGGCLINVGYQNPKSGPFQCYPSCERPHRDASDCDCALCRGGAGGGVAP